jgi:hypothetical protein
MTNETTTIKVFTRDRDWLTDIFGAPTHIAFHKLISTGCIHPEESRTYTTALISVGDEPWDKGKKRMVSGFYCEQCHSYVLPDPRSS